MMRIAVHARHSLAALAGCTLSAAVLAQAPAPAPLPAQPTVNVSATATANIANDRMHAWLRAEAEHADPAAAAAAVNGRMAAALARAKAVPAAEVATSGYSTYQVAPKGQPVHWRVSQTLSVQGTDFAAITALVSRLQGEDGLLLSGVNFSVSDAARRGAEDRLTQQAIKAWQSRAERAAQGLGFQGWRVGRVTVQTGDTPRPYPVMRAGPMMAADAAPPVAVEAGTTDVTVTVTGDAILEPSRAAGR
jgi:predicted secreted protein